VVQSSILASQVQDDAFREIQLNGKQLVFLFMVATVVSVVIFFCGVFVGRGVRAERPALSTDTSASTPIITPDAATSHPTRTPAESDPTKATPPQVVDEKELSYPYRLEKSGQPAEELKPAGREPAAPVDKPTSAKAPPASKPVAVDAKAGKPAKAVPTPGAPIALPPAEARVPPAATDRSPATAAAAEPAGQGFALQVTALRERNEAEAIAKRLSSKGYAAYVMTPARGTPSMYRVRVGKFKTRREAQTMASKLKKEEQFTPWITR
jgi:cell division protein FtsN